MTAILRLKTGAPGRDGLPTNYSEAEIERMLIGYAWCPVHFLKRYTEKGARFSRPFQTILLQYSSNFFFSLKMDEEDEELLEYFCTNFVDFNQSKLDVKVSNLFLTILEQTEELCYKMLRWCGALIGYMPNDIISKEMVIQALKNDALPILFVESKRKELIE